MNNNNDYVAGFDWRRSDRTAKRGNWLRDVAIALGHRRGGDASVHGRRRPCAAAHHPDQRHQPHRHGDGDDRQVAGRAHRQQLRRRHGRRSGGGRRQSAHRSHAVDPGQEDRHHPRVGLCRGQEADRHLRRRSVLRHHAPDQRAQAPLPALEPAGLDRQRPHHAVRRGRRCRHARQGGDHRAPVRAGNHQFGLGHVAAAGHAGSALHRDFAHRRPRTGRAVEPLRRQQHHQYRQPHQGICQSPPADPAARNRRGRALRRVAVRLHDRPAWWRAASPPTL